MKTFLVVYSSAGHIVNVGIFVARNSKEATEVAKIRFYTTSSNLVAFDLDDLPDEWIYYA